MKTTYNRDNATLRELLDKFVQKQRRQSVFREKINFIVQHSHSSPSCTWSNDFLVFFYRIHIVRYVQLYKISKITVYSFVYNFSKIATC